jgi:hypothetical protein
LRCIESWDLDFSRAFTRRSPQIQCHARHKTPTSFFEQGLSGPSIVMPGLWRYSPEFPHRSLAI